ncbi:hypothetical protein Ddc_11082 [Ditylenchus destructor]|nr:hypothetical protein Ddc_11082 [Ditylenchus destructor]
MPFQDSEQGPQARSDLELPKTSLELVLTSLERPNLLGAIDHKAVPHKFGHVPAPGSSRMGPCLAAAQSSDPPGGQNINFYL